MASGDSSPDTSKITEWRSIVTLVVFVLTNLVVLFPFHIPIFVPRFFYNGILNSLVGLRVIPPRKYRLQARRASVAGLRRASVVSKSSETPAENRFVKMRFPMNFITAPLIADLFLLAISAIGKQEVHDGTVGAENISPLDIMAFFLTLAYIAISIDASGVIRFLAFKVLQWGGEVGHRLFFYLYAFFFVLGSFVGNDPIVLSGTAFLAYMTRVSSNIVHPRAWIHTQFAVANIASAILVSSNPTNLVLAGAFSIKFIDYTANMIVPVIITAIVLFPFLLYIVFANESLIPQTIKMHELPEGARSDTPVNPNIPHARGAEGEEAESTDGEKNKMLSLSEILNPFLDKTGAIFGAVVMAATLITVLALNAASTNGSETPVFWITCPAAFVMFCWDLGCGWYRRKQTREIARKGRLEVERARIEKMIRLEDERAQTLYRETNQMFEASSPALAPNETSIRDHGTRNVSEEILPEKDAESREDALGITPCPPNPVLLVSEKSDGLDAMPVILDQSPTLLENPLSGSELQPKTEATFAEMSHPNSMEDRVSREMEQRKDRGPSTLVSKCKDGYRWLQDTFPTAVAVVSHLPFALVPFALAMFVLVQGLVTKGWVEVFAYGWDHWVNKTGTVGSVGGMGFLSAVLCNFAGTNIGTTILLSRVIQAWEQIHKSNGTTISSRTFWATIYSMAIGVNYGAFSTAFSASLAGLLWRDILERKHIHVRGLDFARVNLPIISIAMAVGCSVLVGQVYITRDDSPYKWSS